MTLRILIAILLIKLCVAQNHPQCPNNQKAKENKDGSVIQCLPGSSQKVVCGIDHACFFTGMNYVCCPSNEPTVANQPSCPKPLLTVLAANGQPMKCSPRSRYCPSKTMVCSDVGLAYICCEKSIGRDPPQVVDPKPKWEETLECPVNSLGVLTDLGNRVICNSKRRCPKREQFCYGGLKRSICCERVETAGTVQDDVATITKKKNLKRVSLTSGTTRSPKLVELRSSTSVPTIINSDSFVSSGHKPKSLAIVMKPSKLKRVELPSTTAEPINSDLDDTAGFDSRTAFLEKVHNTQGSLQVKKSNRLERLNSSERAHSSFEAAQPATRRIFTTTTTTTTQEPVTTPLDIVTETEESSTTSPAVSTQRPRVHAVKTSNVQEKQDFANNVSSSHSSEFAPTQTLPLSQSVPKNEKRQMAQTYLMKQIRDGWPYNERFFRPGEQA